MPETQLELVPAHRPLLEKFGNGFFKSVPSLPGVYVMTGRDERILYVGQSANLHARLGAYKNARAGKISRKTLHLVHAVESITWEVCPSPHAAILRENALLRLHRPRFNRANTYPAAYSFITLKLSAASIELGRTTNPSAPGELFGAFKAQVIAGYAGLLRLTWAALNQPAGIHAFPRRLLSNQPPASWCLHHSQDPGPCGLPTLLREFLGGSSDLLFSWLDGHLSAPEALHPFHRAFQQTDLDSLRAFFLAGPRRNRVLSRRHRLPASLIPQEELDDLLAHPVTPGSRNASASEDAARCENVSPNAQVGFDACRS